MAIEIAGELGIETPLAAFARMTIAAIGEPHLAAGENGPACGAESAIAMLASISGNCQTRKMVMDIFIPLGAPGAHHGRNQIAFQPES